MPGFYNKHKTMVWIMSGFFILIVAGYGYTYEAQIKATKNAIDAKNCAIEYAKELKLDLKIEINKKADKKDIEYLREDLKEIKDDLKFIRENM